MRVLALTSLYPNPLQPHHAGHNRRLLQHLAGRHEVSVVAPIFWTKELAGRWHGGKLPPGRTTVVDGIPVWHPCYLFTPKVLRGWYGYFYLWSVRRAFRRASADFRPDVVFAPWAYPDGWAGVRLARAAGLPVVVQVMGSDILRMGEWSGRRRRTLEAVRRADAVVAVSRDLSDRLVGHGVAPEKVRVVYRGVDADLFRPGPRREARERLGLPQDVPLLLFVGNLEPVKGLDVLLEACKRLAAGPTPFTCLLIGQGSLRRRLERQARELGLGDRVRFLGPVAGDLLPDWYRAATVLVLPSRSEGVPNVLREAAACGIPFVASRVGGVPEVAHLAPSRLVTPNDPGLLAEAVAAFLGGGDVPARVHVPPPSWDESAAELAAVFEEVLGAPPAREPGGPGRTLAPGRPRGRPERARNSMRPGDGP